MAKWKHGLYSDGVTTSWLKIKNPSYSQAVGRGDLFEQRGPMNGTSRRRSAPPVLRLDRQAMSGALVGWREPAGR
ncbi:MAG: hypothetical protein DMF90_06125 [Acidobacteria bacterium]|nr:MAG: hypothetical protein DMF90_06125 [Acidobacteriota bacterium]